MGVDLERRRMLEEFLANHPNDSFARYGLALEMANAGEVEPALAEFRKLIATDRDYTAAYQMLAQTLVKEGRRSEARPVLEEGVASAKRAGNAKAEHEMQALLEELETFG